MATAKTAMPATHGKLHKRNISDTSTSMHSPSPSMPSTAFMASRPSLDYKRKVTYEQPEDMSTSSSSMKIKPYFRKLSAKDSGIVDLSRPAAENEGLAGLGLGINDGLGYGFTSKSVSDVSFVPMGSYSKNRHIRSPSNTSQYSTATANSLQRPNAPYAHPMRQTPRPYTPPISKSYTTSLSGRNSEDYDTINEARLPEEELTFRRLTTASTDPQGRDSISSVPTNIATPQPLHVRTSDSLTRFTSPSQTSLNIGGRSRGATLQSVDTLSPSSRPSMDKGFGFFRAHRADTNESLDPDESRAASIRAARKAFEEREEAKARKLEKEESRQMEREQKKQQKKSIDQKRRKSEGEEGRRSRLRSDSSNEKVDDAAVAGREYATLKPVNSRTLPNRVERISPGRRSDTTRSERERNRERQKHGAKRNWFGFLAWFRTRLLRLGRRMGMS
ncbi:hypothetical protein NA57DRAFT_81299 [Rhizodiscina lignyota]|uniref:Uncharacterized protein n=1 Tax=Rhizodiscina lignyota TaxID=1504668 RepID=A0A9P4M1E8_9PEZI|nr:hypothetical protein NA57DRAFT_81299 [Rhizodiscina lignyota]